jgi:hypothetical protein
MPRGAERHATTRSKCQVMKFARQIGRGVGTNRLRLSIRERSGPYKKQHAAAACCLKRHAKHKSRWIATSIVPDTVFPVCSGCGGGQACICRRIRRVGVNAIDQMMQLGRTIILLEPDALFASATLDVKRYCVLNSRSGVRYRTAAAAGKFP